MTVFGLQFYTYRLWVEQLNNIACLHDPCNPVCSSLRQWAVCWLPPPQVLPQQQLGLAKGCQDWCPSHQVSRCPPCHPSRKHLDLAKRQLIQNLLSQTRAHTRSATANVKVRKRSFMFTWTCLRELSRMSHWCWSVLYFRGVPFANGGRAVSG